MDQGVSIVIATRDRSQLLKRALEQAARHARPSDEIVIVDSASAPGTVAEVAVGHPSVSIIRVDEPGTSRARNAGWRAAARELIAFIDDDCLVEENWPDAVERALSDPGVGFVTGRVLGDRETSLGISLLLDDEPRRFDAPLDPGLYGHGSNMAFRREALEAVAGFDEGLGPGTPLRAAEDQDIFWRLIGSGWRGVYDPRVSVIHLQWRSRGLAISRHFAYGVGAGAVAVKMIRAGDALGWLVLRRHLWRDGLALTARSLVRGHKSAFFAGALKLAGVVVGALRARLARLEGNVFGVGTH